MYTPELDKCWCGRPYVVSFDTGKYVYRCDKHGIRKVIFPGDGGDKLEREATSELLNGKTGEPV